MFRTTRITTTVILSIFLVACGGGGDSTTAATTQTTTPTSSGSGASGSGSSSSSPTSPTGTGMGMTTGGSGSTAPASPESGESTSPAPALQLDETARFNVPYDFGSDSAGNLYVHDRQNNAIRKIAPDGKVSTVLTGLSGVYAATFDAHGNIYLLNSDSIIKVTPDGTRSALVTGYNDLTKGPVSMTVDSNETLYVNGHVTDANGNADIGTIWKTAFVNVLVA